MNKRILILGGSGMAGHTLSFYFNEAGYDVTVFTRTPFVLCRNIQGDASDFDNLRAIIEKGNYDFIVNCIGILNQFAERKPLEAKVLNTDLPHFIAEVTKDTSSKLIHMSTDCVFSGNTGPYKEDSFKDGRSVYDITKANGEINDDKNLTFRNSIIGPDLHVDGIGLFNWFMKQSGHIEGYTKAIWTGVTTLTLAKAIEQAMKTNLCGLYHLVNDRAITKYELLNLFNEYFKDGKLTIIPSERIALDKTLLNTRKDFNFQVPSYDSMINEMRNWICDHKHFYLHYRV